MRRGRLIAGAAAAAAAAALLGVCLSTPQAITATGFAMGSVLTQTRWALPRAAAKFPALSVPTVLAPIQELEKELLQAAQPPALALEIMEASGGAFDPYIGALVRLWNIDSKDGSPPHLPTQAEIDEALQTRVLDPGAYGKGMACDTALEYDLHAYKTAVLNLGGNILTYGKKPWGQPFKIALRDPNGGENDTFGVFTLSGTNFISTSGSYEKFFERDGVRYHHIFDPATGRPAARDPGLVSVTVITSGEGARSGEPRRRRRAGRHALHRVLRAGICGIAGSPCAIPL